MTAPHPSTASAPAILALPGRLSIAYHRTPARGDAGAPGIVFLGGFGSDMTGTKATRLEAFAQARGLGFVRFDYFGHGASSGRFEEGTIGHWGNDALAVLDGLTEGRQILVGSSMGGWLMLLVARERPERIAGLLGLAAAPDFTEDLIWDQLGSRQREALQRDGRIEQPSDYGQPYVITRDLISEGRDHLVLRSPLRLPCPVRLIHGTADNDVPFDRSQMLLDAIEGDDVELTLLKNADHRLSDERSLQAIERTLDGLLAKVAGSQAS